MRLQPTRDDAASGSQLLRGFHVTSWICAIASIGAAAAAFVLVRADNKSTRKR